LKFLYPRTIAYPSLPFVASPFFFTILLAIKQANTAKVNPGLPALALFRRRGKVAQGNAAVAKFSYGDVFDLANSFTRHSENPSRFFQSMIRLFADAKSHADYLFLSGTESRQDSLQFLPEIGIDDR
jgi:hypothetical protein